MAKTLKTLAHNNAEAHDRTIGLNAPRLNGVACPNCGEELYDTNPMVVLTSYPAQKHIHCGNCDFRGTRSI